MLNVQHGPVRRIPATPRITPTTPCSPSVPSTAFPRGAGQRFYRRLSDPFFGDGSYGLFDRLYVCTPRDLKKAWDHPDALPIDADVREWVVAHRNRVEWMTKFLGLTTHPYHSEHRGAAFGESPPRVPPMPEDPPLRAHWLATTRNPRNAA